MSWNNTSYAHSGSDSFYRVAKIFDGESLYSALEKSSTQLTRDYAELQHLQSSYRGPGAFAANSLSRVAKNLFVHFAQYTENENWGKVQLHTFNHTFCAQTNAQKDDSAPHNLFLVPIVGFTNFQNSLPHFGSAALYVLEYEKVKYVAMAATFPEYQEAYYGCTNGGIWFEKKFHKNKLKFNNSRIFNRVNLISGICESSYQISGPTISYNCDLLLLMHAAGNKFDKIDFIPNWNNHFYNYIIELIRQETGLPLPAQQI